MEQVDITLTARGEQAAMPWIFRLCREFAHLKSVSIIKANVDGDFGWVQLKLEGPVEEIQRATAWLMTTGLHVDAEQRALGAL
jgi:hypothetical protein